MSKKKKSRKKAKPAAPRKHRKTKKERAIEARLRKLHARTHELAHGK